MTAIVLIFAPDRGDVATWGQKPLVVELVDPFKVGRSTASTGWHIY